MSMELDLDLDIDGILEGILIDEALQSREVGQPKLKRIDTEGVKVSSPNNKNASAGLKTPTKAQPTAYQRTPQLPKPSTSSGPAQRTKPSFSAQPKSLQFSSATSHTPPNT